MKERMTPFAQHQLASLVVITQIFFCNKNTDQITKKHSINSEVSALPIEKVFAQLYSVWKQKKRKRIGFTGTDRNGTDMIKCW